MKPLYWIGGSQVDVRAFPAAVRRDIGYALWRVQGGADPPDWKPFEIVGKGVREIRVRDETGAFRVMYVARFEEAIYVLHAFQKKTAKAAKRDVDLAAARYKLLMEGRR